MLSFCHKVRSNGKLSHDAGYIKKKKSKGNSQKDEHKMGNGPEMKAPPKNEQTMTLKENFRCTI
jgi:hypothetical protein